MQPVAIISSGMMTGVGLSAPAACAAIRCAIDGFNETRFMDKGGSWIIGCAVPLEQPWRGRAKLVQMAVPAIRECLAGAPGVPEQIPFFLCIAEPDRPGRLDGLDDQLPIEIGSALGMKFHPRSAVIARGRVSVAYAIEQARKLIDEQFVPCCLIAGVDSMLVGPTLSVYEERHHLLTSKNSDGFIPGEAAAAVLVGPLTATKADDPTTRQLAIIGLGMGQEKATIDSELPLRADGMVAAFQAAQTDAGVTIAATDYRLTDLNGSQYYFKEAALAMNRVLRVRKAQYEIWHPADCIGETGAASGPSVLAVALAAAKKGYGPGPGVLCHFSADGGDRAAMILNYSHVKGAN